MVFGPLLAPGALAFQTVDRAAEAGRVGVFAPKFSSEGMFADGSEILIGEAFKNS